MKSFGLDYIDYWQATSAAERGLKSRFGIRAEDRRFWALVQLGDDEARTFGKPYEIPADFSALPSYLRMIVNDYQVNYRNSDLLDVLAGRKSFHEALKSAAEQTKLKRMTATRTVRLPHAS